MGKIELRNVTKRFGDLVAVNDVDVTFPDGAYTMILGPSGCGKSTTLRMIAGLERPSNGDVYIDEERVTDKPPRLRDISMVFQNLALWNHKTVEENMEFGLKMHDVEKDARRERVQEIAAILQISDKLDESPANLSGGQQQRVALGRSLVRNPEVLLLDEPLSSLDEKLRLEMRAELARIQQEVGTTFVHVTHNQEDAMSIADQILLLDAGEVQQYGDPMALYHRPANEFVADFVGTPSMNIFDATYQPEQPSLRADGVELLVDFDDDSIHEGAVRAGIRPEALRINPTDEEGSMFDATVELIETFGDFNWYYLDAGLASNLVVQSADDRVMSDVGVGDRVTVAVGAEDIRLFDTATGDAIS